MFAILATKPLNDGTQGFRYNFLGRKGVVRKRKKLSRGWKVVRGDGMTALHMGRLTVYVEHNKNKRKLKHFAG